MRRLLTGIGEAKGEHIGARHDRKELLTIDAVSRRRSRDDVACIEMPQRLPGFRVEYAHLAKLLGGKYDSASCGQQPGAVVIRPNGLVLPDSLSGEGI